jgi:hypothetical protein
MLPNSLFVIITYIGRAQLFLWKRKYTPTYTCISVILPYLIVQKTSIINTCTRGENSPNLVTLPASPRVGPVHLLARLFCAANKHGRGSKWACPVWCVTALCIRHGSEGQLKGSLFLIRKVIKREKNIICRKCYKGTHIRKSYMYTCMYIGIALRLMFWHNTHLCILPM